MSSQQVLLELWLVHTDGDRELYGVLGADHPVDPQWWWVDGPTSDVFRILLPGTCTPSEWLKIQNGQMWLGLNRCWFELKQIAGPAEATAADMEDMRRKKAAAPRLRAGGLGRVAKRSRAIRKLQRRTTTPGAEPSPATAKPNSSGDDEKAT